MNYHQIEFDNSARVTMCGPCYMAHLGLVERWEPVDLAWTWRMKDGKQARILYYWDEAWSKGEAWAQGERPKHILTHCDVCGHGRQRVFGAVRGADRSDGSDRSDPSDRTAKKHPAPLQSEPAQLALFGF